MNPQKYGLGFGVQALGWGVIGPPGFGGLGVSGVWRGDFRVGDERAWCSLGLSGGVGVLGFIPLGCDPFSRVLAVRATV